MTSVRWPFRIFNRHRLQNHRVNGFFQAAQGMRWDAQMGHNNAVSDLGSVYLHKANGLQGGVPNSTGEAAAADPVEIYEGGIAARNSGNFALNGGQNFGYRPGDGCGFIGHNGSSTIFVWDATKGCMVPYRESIGRRLRRSVDAFAQAWRLGHG